MTLIQEKLFNIVNGAYDYGYDTTTNFTHDNVMAKYLDGLPDYVVDGWWCYENYTLTVIPLLEAVPTWQHKSIGASDFI